MTLGRGGLWHGYRDTCDECTARAIARSLAAFTAIRRREPSELRELIARLLPRHPYEQAREMVWRWWRLDHPPIETDPQETPNA